MYTATVRGLGLALCVLLAACAHSPVNDPSDPLEGMNRAVFSFNEGLDHYVARPVAQGYVSTVPETARKGISNFIANITYPTTIINDLLQGKLLQFCSDTGRFTVNTIIGIGGFIDVAKPMGLEKHDEDFGQTLGSWGVGSGIYLMVPLYGPSSARDLIGSAAAFMTNPTTHLPMRIAAPFDTVDFVDLRAEFLDVDDVLEQQPDRYLFVRDAYLQHRESLVYDGSPPINASEYEEEDEPVKVVPVNPSPAVPDSIAVPGSTS